jgi:hypothetical protein
VFGRRVLGGWAASIFIDIDHYLWYCVRYRSVNPLAAMRVFNGPESPHHPITRVFHNPVAISALLMLGARRRRLLPVAIGMALHVAVDGYHEARMNRVRAAAMRRDGFTCQECGAKGSGVVTHLQRQPWLLPSYDIDRIITLCASCHEAAHAGPELSTTRDRHGSRKLSSGRPT